jgi:hypothetical protein
MKDASNETTSNSSPEAATNSDHPDNFDPSHLRLSQSFADVIGVRKALITVPVRKPGRQDFIRVHPSADYRLETAVLELKEERETYLVAPELWPEIPTELVPKVLYTTMNRQGVLSIWPIRLPGEDGRLDQWNTSALEAAEMAQHAWIRIVANMSLGAYEVYEATGDIPEPSWPDMSYHEILKIAFKGLYITEIDHPVIRRLRGDV